MEMRPAANAVTQVGECHHRPAPALLCSQQARNLAVPPEVIRRLGKGPVVKVEDLAQEIQCERDRLGGATWMAVLGIVPILGFVAFAGGLLIVSVFLPLHQLIGNLAKGSRHLPAKACIA